MNGTVYEWYGVASFCITQLDDGTIIGYGIDWSDGSSFTWCDETGGIPAWTESYAPQWEAGSN